jgi:branched-chain amino acid aminotransferase
MPTVVNLDGALVPPAQAVVSVFDRGFLYGDSVYEVIRTYGGRPFELAAHLRRLAHSAERIGLAPAWGPERALPEIERTLAASRRGDPEEASDPDAASWNAGERYLRLIMTRGAGELGLDPALAVDPRAIVIVQPLRGPPARAYEDGVKACVVGIRHASPSTVDPSAKTGAHLNHVLAVHEARAQGAHEALLLDDRGLVTEGASSNVFAVRGGRVATPPLAAGILEGVTRGVVLAVAREAGVPVDEVPLRPEALASADELFITSTVREILPVSRLGEGNVGNGRAGPVTRRLHALFRRRASGGADVG